MKKMKKVISLLLAFIMCIGMVSVVSAASNPFSDVKSTDYFAEAVAWAVEKNVTQGIGGGKFGPEQPCIRGQVVTFLWRAAGEPEPATKTNPFTDVKSTDYYYKAVLWAVENGITTGVGNGKFGPEQPCTRGQVVTFLWRTAGEPNPKSATNPFSDVKSADYFYKAVLWAVEKNITQGTGAGKFSPEQTCTRGQIVTFLYRYFNDAAEDTGCQHKYDNACDTSCNVCGETRNTSHKFDNACDADCNVCGAHRAPEAHKYDNACDADCNVCKAKRTPEAHKYDNECDAACNVCKASRTAPHKYDHGCDNKCNLCGTTRKTVHEYPSNPYGYKPCKNCGNPYISVSGPITLDKNYVPVGGTFTASVTATGGKAPYTVEWTVYKESGTIEILDTSMNPTITVTEELFNNNKQIKLYCTVVDAEGNYATPMDYAYINYVGTLEVDAGNLGGLVADGDFMDPPVSSISKKIAFLNRSIGLTGVDPTQCTFKWEWSHSATADFKEIPSGSGKMAASINGDGIYISPENVNKENPLIMVSKDLLDMPIYIKVTVTAPGGQVKSSVSPVVFRNIGGSTGSANHINSNRDPIFAVTPKGGNGKYGYEWGLKYSGSGGEHTLTSQISSSYYDGEDTSILTFDRWGFDNRLSGVTHLWCRITSAGKSETIYISITE